MVTKKVSAVKRKLVISDDKISEIISRGGQTTLESKEKKSKELRFTIKIPTSLANKIDEERKKRIGHVSRNQWILEAVDYYVQRGNE